MSNSEAVFSIIRAIPRGRVATHAQVARLASTPGGARTVGQMLQNLPVNTCLPWHRVVNSRGEIAFLADSQNYNRQVRRLVDEGVEVISGKIALQQFQWPA